MFHLLIFKWLVYSHGFQILHGIDVYKRQVITIPQDFSANAATLTDDQPREMELDYETNPGTNYIASKLSETAMKEIQAGVREEVTKTYAETMLDQLTHCLLYTSRCV